MPSAEDIYASPYLNSDDIGDSEPTVTILEIGPERMGQSGEDKKTKLTCRVTGFRKKLVINATNGKRLIKAWGDDYSKWAGKQARLLTDDITVRGEDKRTIIVLPIDTPPQAGSQQ